jgi:RNA polymerase sigma factor (sigma-70 family)
MKTENPFSVNNYTDQKDLELIATALNGNKESLSNLIKRHQQFIFNVALKMINNIADAEDVTQEILIKLVTNLSKYDSSKGKFRTWLYRVTFNHILNIKKQSYEKDVTSFDVFFDYIEGSPVIELSTEEETEMSQAIEESKVACMAGMLMCLDREQRLIYTVGEIFEIDHNLASEIFETTPDNFRQKLSRARKDLYQWMNNKCGLVNKDNPCRCPKKTKGFIKNGWVTSNNMKWHSDYKQKIKDLSDSKVDEVLLARDNVYAKLYREHPFKNHNKSEKVLAEILNNKTIRDTLNLN